MYPIIIIVALVVCNYLLHRKLKEAKITNEVLQSDLQKAVKQITSTNYRSVANWLYGLGKKRAEENSGRLMILQGQSEGLLEAAQHLHREADRRGHKA